MSNNIKIVIPTAGWATRLRPQTWSKPKPLVSVAGRTILDHLLASFHSLPNYESAGYVLILGPFLGEIQIPPYMKEHHPGLTVEYVTQSVMRGQSDALWLAREHLDGPLVMCFSDTLIEADFSILANEKADGVAWVKPVQDPRRFGVAEVDEDGWVTRLIEKPSTKENNRVVVGCYYFHDGRQLVSAIEEQMQRKKTLKGEYFLTDAISIMLERGAKIRTQITDTWLDTGTIESTLATNRYLLQHSLDDTHGRDGKKLKILPPVYIHESAVIANSTIGPNVSIGADCRITGSRVEDSILEAGAEVDTVALKGSFIGRHARVHGLSAQAMPMVLNIGDDSSVVLG